MKKNFLSGGYYPKTPSGKKILRTMRISTFLLGACVFCSYAEDSHSQNARVSINKNNSQLEEILNEIESQTDYLFIYNNQVDVNRKVSVKAKTKPVSEVLDNLFKNAGVEYEMEGTHIILSSKSRDAIAAAQQQTHVLTGRIVDNNGEAIIGANVVVKGTTNGTVTDIDGNFSIEADPNSVLNISYIGYLSKEIVVGNQKTINVVLLEDTKTLDEVVVIGYGTQKKADLTGSVANVSTDDLNTQSNTTIGQALQGNKKKTGTPRKNTSSATSAPAIPSDNELAGKNLPAMWQRNDYKRKNRVWLFRMEKRVYLQEVVLTTTLSFVQGQQNLYIIEFKQVCTRRSIASVYEKQYAQSSRTNLWLLLAAIRN